MALFERIKKLTEAYNTIKSYRHKSVFYRFWFLIVIGFVAVFVSVVLLVGNYNNSKYYNNISAMLSKNMYNMRNSLDSVFSEIISETKKISENETIMKALTTDSTDKKEEISELLRKIHSETDFVKSIYIYSLKNDYVFSSSVIYKSAPMSEFEDNMWHDTYYTSGSEVFLRQYPENSIFRKCISVCKKINGSDDIVAVFNINYDKFNIIRNKNVLMDYEISMINDSGVIIYSTDNEKVGKDVNLYKDMCSTYFMSVNNYTVNSKNTSSSLFESVQTKNARLSIVAEILKKNIDDMSGTRNRIIIISFGVLLILLILSVFIAIKFYGSILAFIERIPQNGKNENENTNEIKEIENRISNIINKKSETESELAESLMQLQKAQSIALQSQFSPHFLFNTLQMINSIAFAEFGGDSDISTAVGLLCDILRVAMDTTEYTCRLGDEIDLAKKYIQLQNMKYEDAFDVDFDIDDETLDITVAKLFLQPILENSMHHGFDVRSQSMKINISAHIVENKLIIKDSDDGLGMSEERKQAVSRSLDNKQLEKKNSIGLLNLSQRIKLIFGYEYGCKIDNNEDKGVTVTITFPYR